MFLKPPNNIILLIPIGSESIGSQSIGSESIESWSNVLHHIHGLWPCEVAPTIHGFLFLLHAAECQLFGFYCEQCILVISTASVAARRHYDHLFMDLGLARRVS